MQAKPASKKNTSSDKAALLKAKEAQRRQVLKESIARREQYTQLWLQWHQKLLQPTNERVLKQAARYLTPQDYQDVVEERAATKLCGYPLCNQATQKIEQKYRISLARRKVYDVSEQANFCSKTCMVASRFYREQLPEEAIYMRSRTKEIPIQVLPLGSKLQDRVEEPQADDMEWYRKSLLSSMKIPAAVADANPLQVVEHKTQEVDVVEGMAQLSFAEVEGFVSETDMARIKKDVKSAVEQKQPVAEKPMDAGGSDEEETLPMSEVLTGILADDSDDENEQQTSADQGHFAKLFASENGQQVGELSLFGRMWMLIDRISTKNTNLLLKDLQQTGDIFGNAASYYSSPGDHSMAIRQGLLADSVAREATWIMSQLQAPIEVDRELRMLVSTLELHSNMAVFTKSELQLLGIVFVLALARSMDTLQQAASKPEASRRLEAMVGGLGGDMSLMRMLAQRLHEPY
ncbi:hypothetical protein LPJ78_004225 [Coemansia sp. RSA 989]|nr:hypothetical protein LPJ68_003601 [Coemansia sp. RSA 1086]KAJ1863152.1 hypothetical protein LPJ78_004225 [Coemansia sp. RSA 989]KAJ1870932.1 hypothetical protein LPJ55_004276 [Coemansia sp. RSA 990]KAJ2632022.1 hypothetical protein H4R22_001568 [Coemansia sp. RSA 1290]KAJ2646730.1 hypothetical protein IWW40_005214 [Coemansia sp. RSA 1250]